MCVTRLLAIRPDVAVLLMRKLRRRGVVVHRGAVMKPRLWMRGVVR